jgi:hypothetical protein
VNKTTQSSANEEVANLTTTLSEEENIALKRAQDLVNLCYEMKVKHLPGSEPVVDQELIQARLDVNRVASELKKRIL